MKKPNQGIESTEIEELASLGLTMPGRHGRRPESPSRAAGAHDPRNRTLTHDDMARYIDRFGPARLA